MFDYAHMKIAIATDAWSPQVNGVVTTLKHTRDELRAMGHDILMITPQGRRSIACPTYPEIRLSILPHRAIAKELAAFNPDCIHIATEGSIGFATRRYCVKHSIAFTSAYHTQLPEYVKARTPVPVAWTSALLRWFHGGATRTMVPTNSIRDQLEMRGFDNVVIWSRGVDTNVFTPLPKHDYTLPRPIWINMGRVAIEKNIEAFLDLDLPGSKVVIGDGPDLEKLRHSYPGVHFEGYRFGKDLANYVAGGDVFVFPSKTDTFGLVMLEAMSCGLPVAAYPVTGPIDVVRHGITGALNKDLNIACKDALTLDRTGCRVFAESRSWKRSAEQFVTHLTTSKFDSQRMANGFQDLGSNLGG